MKYRMFWHVTPMRNLYSILERGVDPSYAKSNRALIWFVEWKGLLWALAHVSARYGVPVNQLVAIRIQVREGQYTHHRLSMWYSNKIQKRAMFALPGDKALRRWENQREGCRQRYGHGAKRERQ
jgi:hypothetical protein